MNIRVTNCNICSEEKRAAKWKISEYARENFINCDSASITCQINYFDLESISFATFNVIHNKTSLKKLDLSCNRISQIQPDTFNQFESLEILSIAKNFLVHISSNYFSADADAGVLRELTVVDLSSNLIENVDKESFEKLGSLLWLNLADNCLITLILNLPLRALDTLNLSMNKLESFPRLNALVAIDTLDLSHNTKNILNSSSEFSRIVRSVKSLNIADNSLSNLHQLQWFSNLERLSVASNPIYLDGNFHLLLSQKLFHLRKLNLTSINLQSLESLESHLNCKQFTSLSIDKNPIEADFRLMKCFQNLQHLRFSQRTCQEFQNFYHEIRMNFPHLNRVEIEYEEANCDCALKNHEKFSYFYINFTTNWSQVCSSSSSKGQHTSRVEQTSSLSLLILGLIAFLM